MMGTVLISTKGQIVLPVSVRRAPELKPGMHVNVEVDGKGARLTPAMAEKTATLDEIQALLKYSGPTVPVDAMRVTDCKG